MHSPLIPSPASQPSLYLSLSPACRHGYDYDHTYYERTAVTQENWVCDKELYVTNTFVFNRLGEVVGTFFIGQMGD